jgi:hypothetical protein
MVSAVEACFGVRPRVDRADDFAPVWGGGARRLDWAGVAHAGLGPVADEAPVAAGAGSNVPR